MILSTLFRMLWVAVAFSIAALAALAVLFALGAMWAGSELRAAAPDDPLIQDGAPIFGLMLFANTVGPALTVLPALIVVVAGEVLRVRSWIYYLLAGGLALAAIPVMAVPDMAELPAIIASRSTTIFATAGFAGGFIYWLLAGARA